MFLSLSRCQLILFIKWLRLWQLCHGFGGHYSRGTRPGGGLSAGAYAYACARCACARLRADNRFSRALDDYCYCLCLRRPSAGASPRVPTFSRREGFGAVVARGGLLGWVRGPAPSSTFRGINRYAIYSTVCLTSLLGTVKLSFALLSL